MDSDAGQQCKKNERSLEWDTGPVPALSDAFVASRQEPVDIPRSTETELVRLTLQPGDYLVTGKAQISNSEPFEPLAVGCKLVPSNEDGTPGDEDGPDSDQGGFLLERAGEPGSTAALALFASQRLSQPGSVRLLCTATAFSGTGPGGFANYRSIRAIEVGSITNDPGVPPLP